MDATKSIPIVFVTGIDPITAGLVQSLSRPGGNATGLSLFSGELGKKRLELMREIVPEAEAFGVLLNPANPRLDWDIAELQKYSDERGHHLLLIHAGSDAEIETAFRKLSENNIKVLLIESDPFFTTRVNRLALLARKNRIAASYAYREFATADGLVSYGTDLPDIYRQAAQYVGRILSGVAPGELPVQQPRKYPLILNLKTAAALGLNVPQSVLARADEVIE
jgi:putative ABC transport system substrate-binding protein